MQSLCDSALLLQADVQDVEGASQAGGEHGARAASVDSPWVEHAAAHGAGVAPSRVQKGGQVEVAELHRRARTQSVE